MSKKIKLELTEDQVKEIISGLEALLPSMDWWIDEYPSKRAYADANPNLPDLRAYTDRVWSPEKYDKLQRKTAFRRRLIDTLAKAKI